MNPFCIYQHICATGAQPKRQPAITPPLATVTLCLHTLRPNCPALSAPAAFAHYRFSPLENNGTFRASFILGLVLYVFIYDAWCVLNTHSHACLCVQWNAFLDGIIQRCTWIWRSFQQLLDLHHQNICDQETMATISGALASWKQGQRNVFHKPALVLNGVTPRIKGKHVEKIL